MAKLRHNGPAHPDADTGNQVNTTAPKLITIDELASMLGMSKRTVWRLLSAGQIPEPIRLGGCTRWRLDLVRQWIDSGCPAADN